MINLFKKVNNKKPVKKVSKDSKRKQTLYSKQELRQLYTGFNQINGYVPEYNLIINELNDYIAIIECIDYNAVFKLIDNLNKYCIKEIELFSHNSHVYCSLRFTNSYKNIVKNKHNGKSITIKQEEELGRINDILKTLGRNDTEYVILSIKEILKIATEKVFKSIDISSEELRNIIFNKKHQKIDVQNLLKAQKVNIENDLICFNYDKNENNKIYHKILGLQLYPSYLYEGYLSEINNLKAVETCTYIRNVDKQKIHNNLKEVKTGQLLILKKYIDSVDKLYLTCFFIHIYGSIDEIKDSKDKVFKISNKYNVHLNEFNKQQKRAYDAFLPFMNNKIKCYRQIDNINGIMPQNDNLIYYFNTKFCFGKELNSDTDLCFKRKENGVLLSSNKDTKDKLINKEKKFLIVDREIPIQTYNFCLSNLEKKYADKLDIYKNIITNNYDSLGLDDYQKYLLFKAYMNLCLAYYRNGNGYVDRNDKEDLNITFNKFEKLFLFKDDIEIKNYNEIINSLNTQIDNSFVDRINSYIKNNNNKLFLRIYNVYNNPTKEMKLLLAGIYSLFVSVNDKKMNYIFVSNIEEIACCLDIIFYYFSTFRFNNTYMFYSDNDFVLLNNEYICKYMFNLKFINIIDIISSDLSKVANYLYLSNSDITHLNNKKYIAGRLLTNICEFNYYIEKENIKDEI